MNSRNTQNLHHLNETTHKTTVAPQKTNRENNNIKKFTENQTHHNLQQRRGTHMNNNIHQLAQIYEQVKTHPKKDLSLEQNDPTLATQTANQNWIQHYLENDSETTTGTKE